MNPHDIQDRILKAGSAWALIGITSWAEFGAMLGAFYTSLLIAEWMWKKAIRPYLCKRGVVAPLITKATDE